MDGISRGTTLGGRYRVEKKLSERSGTAQWLASDTTLGREVTVLTFTAEHPHGEEALDSARRLAGVADQRLTGVLDVGSTEQGLSYIVFEALHHGESLAALLLADTLPAEEVRRIIGESAVALESARQRGLHHGVLVPHDLVRDPGGEIRVCGVAVNAALAGKDDNEHTHTSRADVLALVSCAYAGLTGRWPGTAEAPEVPGVAAVTRRADGQLPAPSELVSGVPGDLDTLCRTVLSDDEGPRTPGELARQLSPWSAEQVHGRGGRTPEQGGQVGPTPRSGSGRSLATGAAGAASGGAVTRGHAKPSDADSTDPGLLREDDTVVGRRPQFDHDDTMAYRPTRAASPYVSEELEPPLPLLNTGREEPDRDSSRMALSIVAGTLIIALLLGFLGLRSLFKSDPPTAPATNSAGTVAAPGETNTGPGAGGGAVGSGQRVQIVAARSFDPEGDDNEHNEVADRVLDNDPRTEWITHRYSVPTYTRNGKKGAGLQLDLGSSKQVGTVSLTIAGSSIKGAVYVGDQPNHDAANKLGEFSGSGQQSVGGGTPKTGRYVTIWITELGQVSGGYRAQISETQVRS